MFGKRLQLFLFIVTLLQCSLGAPFPDSSSQEELISERATDPGYRLPTDFKPEHYNIRLSDINFETQTFAGSTIITFWCLSSTNTLVLHASGLTITPLGVLIENPNNTSETFPLTMETNDLYEKLIITTNTPFIANNLYKITFSVYTGRMRGMNGFYPSQYTVNGEKEWLGTTQMEPVHARKVFPCFDEPGYKATFTLAIQKPSEDYETSIGNTKIDPTAPNTSNWDQFLETPIMSTYLLAFIVSKFKILNETEDSNGNLFRVVGRPGSEGQGNYAFVEGQNIVNAMSEYMNVNYFSMGNQKMDQAAIPDFSAGAMENWGLITYREGSLLSVESSSVRQKQQISSILAHEIAHMWFGDYVTCHWWSDTWLNEGFASLFGSKIPDMVMSTPYDMMTQFSVDTVHSALSADTTVRSAPMTNNDVNSPSEISGHFGTISYGKSASVLRMMETWLGEENFKAALSHYMVVNAHGVSKPQNLYSALQNFAPEGHNVAEVMGSWVTNSGYPLISVNVNYLTSTVTVNQKRFRKAWESDLDNLFQVPITIATKSKPNFDDTATDHLLTGKSADLSISLSSQDWVVLNKKQLGYYRINYDEDSWYVLRSALMGSERTAIHQINRGQIVDDLFNLAREDVITYKLALDVLEFLSNENEYAPWQSAHSGFSYIRQQFYSNRNLLAKLDSHILELLKNVIQTLGFNIEGDNLTQLFRMNTLNFACSLGHADCVNFAKEAFNSYLMDGTIVPANNREFVYCNGLRYGNDDAFDALLRKFKSENLVNEQLVILTALGCTKSENKIHEIINEVVKPDSLIRDQDMTTPINGIFNGNLENTEVMLKYLENRENFVTLRNRLGSLSSVFSSMASRLTRYQISRFQQLISDNSDILSVGEITSGMNAYSNLALQMSYIIEAGAEIEAWLDAK